MDRYLSPSRTAPSTQMSLLFCSSLHPHNSELVSGGPFQPTTPPPPEVVWDPRLTLNHAPAKRPAPGQPSVVPVVRESDRDLWTWMIDLCILGTHPRRKRSKKPTATLSFSSKPSSSNKVSSFAYGRKTIQSSRILLVCYASIRRNHVIQRN